MQDLARAAQADAGTSMRQLARRAQEHGFKIVDTTLNAIAAGTYKSRPTSETIRAIAWLSHVTDDEAFAAAGQPVPGPPFAKELPPDVDHLSPRHRKIVVELLRVLIDDDLRACSSEGTASQASPASDVVDVATSGAATSRTRRAPDRRRAAARGQEPEDRAGDGPA
ncbi:hypothetical protein [Xylanimonas protaetiae]|uniref:Uncharacterized protein n=1 Tax=Xylanimonas protaetiae TaxID=2509457 RepID=A0A4P6FGR7_9MICO|nr:hypothetical protein [Xylanimonas protaetiae]QAY69808.1 hypothetical protein ET471_06950 [Xylanimonas protaetiae]